MQYLPAESHLKTAEKCLLDNINSQHKMQRVQPKRYLPNPNRIHTENSWEETCIHKPFYRSRKRNNCCCSSIISWTCFLSLLSLLEGSHSWVKKECDEPVCSVHTQPISACSGAICHWTQKCDFPTQQDFRQYWGYPSVQNPAGVTEARATYSSHWSEINLSGHQFFHSIWTPFSSLF